MVYKINDNCLNCAVCLDQCPSTAIVEENEKYVIDPEKCTDCGICKKICPAEAIEEVCTPAKK